MYSQSFRKTEKEVEIYLKKNINRALRNVKKTLTFWSKIVTPSQKGRHTDNPSQMHHTQAKDGENRQSGRP